ncbi:ABC transporter substrate-binding protein [Desulfobacterales bacterium HSG16]|nr:ABC transporter substrate-binding protein [Desulfobacterales bacterium HSG16]
MKAKESRFLYLSALLALVLLTVAANPVDAHHKDYRIALFTPWEKGDMFWGQLVDFMKAATDDLGMRLEVHYAHGSRRKMKEQVQETCGGESPPDALVVLSFRKSGPNLLRIAEESKIPVFLINAGVDTKKLKGPRVVLKHWIGEMLPDDESAGFDLANVLVDAALKAGKAGKDGKVDIVALGGTYTFGPAEQRENGLHRALKLRGDARLKRIVPAHWKRAVAREKFLQLHKIYPDASVYWAANDQIALGVMDASAELGLDVISGGVDWTSQALELIEAGRLTASLGGHFMEGGWAAVLLYDWFHGRDFAEETVTFRSRMGLLTKDTMGLYKKSFHGKGGGWDKIDFRKFSKVLNPEIGSYAFGFEAVLSQVKGRQD